MAEVKRAYRRLAKAYHPDSAGETALPRFLAIHEAYELLASGRTRAAGTRTTRANPAAEPWRADPDRARAARERARSRPRSGASATGRGGARTGTAGPSFGGARTGSSGPQGSTSGSGATGGTGSGTREGRRRATRKATLGSTSYDEAREQADATWSGASWYGPSSGEYWIVNPREYADPRKHGPGYQQRARRGASTTGSFADAESAPDEEPVSDFDVPVDQPSVNGEAPPRPHARAPRASVAGATGTAGPSARDARRWEAAARHGWTPAAASAGASGPLGRRQPGGRGPGDAGPRDPSGWIGSTGRELLGAPTDDPIRRLGLALVAWPPIGLAAAAAIGDITGCTAYSVECAGSDTLLPWLAQAAILGLLLLLPPLARVFVGGTIAVLLALVPTTAFLLVVGAGGVPQAGFALGLLLAAAWLGGVAWAAFGARGLRGRGETG